MKILVTGSAGFIGFHLSKLLLKGGHEVTGIDGFTNYYDISLKNARQGILEATPGFTGHRQMLEDIEGLEKIYSARFDAVFHFAAQAGVRYSLDQPRTYVETNVTGTFNLLELMRHAPPKHALLASTSSVYGANAEIPFRETDRADHPLSLYAATKKATEDMAHSYAHLFAIPITMLRFFTVYGPWGRPDMALFKFVKAMTAGSPIDLYNFGDMKRDFTFVDDLVTAAVKLLDCVPPPPSERTNISATDSVSPQAPYRVINIGGGAPITLVEFVEALERAMGKAAVRNLMPMQAGDVPITYANADLLFQLTGYKPATLIDAGVSAFVDWYKSYYPM